MIGDAVGLSVRVSHSSGIPFSFISVDVPEAMSSLSSTPVRRELRNKKKHSWKRWRLKQTARSTSIMDSHEDEDEEDEDENGFEDCDEGEEGLDEKDEPRVRSGPE